MTCLTWCQTDHEVNIYCVSDITYTDASDVGGRIGWWYTRPPDGPTYIQITTMDTAGVRSDPWLTTQEAAAFAGALTAAADGADPQATPIT